MTDETGELRRQLQQLSAEVAALQDVNAIRRLQHAYGYYLDKCLYDEVVDLFADSGAVHFMNGVFRGKAGVRRLYCDRFRKNFTGGHNGPLYGFLLDHLQLQDIVDIAPDRSSACGRFRALMQAGAHVSNPNKPPMLPQQWWEGGIYENQYVREGGIWKLKVLNYHCLYHALYEKGWAYTPPNVSPPFTRTFPDDPAGPDELVEPMPAIWPQTVVVPFHYTHPVTGKRWAPEGAPEAATLAAGRAV